MDLAGYGLKNDRIAINLDLAEPLANVSADPQQLEQVVLNLVSNAQYALRARPSGRSLTIRTSLDADQQHVTLVVEDNAGGIAPEIRSHIFDPFFTTKPIGQGTGLGLSLCHGIVTAHAGTIAVTSDSDTGTAFTINLPVATTASTFDGDDSDSRSRIKARILVVDDDPDVAIGFSSILLDQGHNVHVATNGLSVLESLDESSYDLVVTDVRMPEIDGPSLYRQIVSRHPHLERCFIFVTGDVFNADPDGFLAQTGAVLLAKPCTSRELEKAVQRILRNRENDRARKPD
jgi:CheY-like chemotaxis protein